MVWLSWCSMAAAETNQLLVLVISQPCNSQPASSVSSYSLKVVQRYSFLRQNKPTKKTKINKHIKTFKVV